VNAAFFQNLLPESLAYQNALGHWRDFQEDVKTLRLDQMLARPGCFGKRVYMEALNLLPPAERRPVLFGELARYAKEFFPSDHARIQQKILPDASAFELDALEAVRRGEIVLPTKLPITLERFPSRIWQRALASGSSQRLVTAGCQGVDQVLRLLFEIHELSDMAGENVIRLPIGDLPEFVDLIALAPRQHLGLKNQLIESLTAYVEAGRSPLMKEMFGMIPAWVFLDDEGGYLRISPLIQEARSLTHELERGENRLKARHRLLTLGRFFFRLGQRGESLRCARALGLSAWAEYWQDQCIGNKAHESLRRHMLRPETDAEAWQREPALACSSMTLPLWLGDGVCRLAALTRLFNHSSEFPWVFPQLYHVFQWHLAIAGRHDVLKQIERISPEDSLGLISPACGNSLKGVFHPG
jgi:hypothetical protein